MPVNLITCRETPVTGPAWMPGTSTKITQKLVKRKLPCRLFILPLSTARSLASSSCIDNPPLPLLAVQKKKTYE